MNSIKELSPGARFDMYAPRGTVIVLGRKVGNSHPVKVTGPSGDEEKAEYTSMNERDLLVMLKSRKGGFSNFPALETTKDTNIFALLNNEHLWDGTESNFIVSFDEKNVINGVFADTPHVEKDKLDKYVILAIKPNEISFQGGKNIPLEFYGQLEVVNWLLSYK